MNKITLSNDVWDDVLRAIGMDRDTNEPMISMTIKLTNDEPVIVIQEKYASKSDNQ